MNTEYKMIFFGEDEAKFLEFIDNHWNRILSGGHSSTMDQMDNFEKPGWYARYSKDAVTANVAKVSKTSAKKAA